MRLPTVHLIEGLRLRHYWPGMVPGPSRPVDNFLVIGRAGSAPFLLSYAGGLTHWQSPADLSQPLRRKILHALRTQVRHAASLPAWCQNMDLLALSHEDTRQALSQHQQGFIADRWRAATLGDRPEDYVDLAVPFSEKDQARAAGAVWDPARKTWRANLALHDQEAFRHWLPASSGPSNPGPK